MTKLARPDREMPVTELGNRVGEPHRIGHTDTPARVVKCRQCGSPTVLTGAGVDAWASCNRTLRRMGQGPLQPDEVQCCDREECRRAERDERRQRLDAERREVDRIVARIRAGEAVSVPPYIRRERPSDWAEIQAALKRRRDAVRQGHVADAEIA